MGSLLHEIVGAVRCFDELNTSEPEAVFPRPPKLHRSGRADHRNQYLSVQTALSSLPSALATMCSASTAGGEDCPGSAGSRRSRGPHRRLDRASRHRRASAPSRTRFHSFHFSRTGAGLEERGVDLFILETFSYIEELLLAIDAIRSFSGLPIIAQLTYSEEGTTYGDVPAIPRRGDVERQKRSGDWRQLHPGPAIAPPDPPRTHQCGRHPRQRHAQRRLSQARGRPHRLPEILA